MAISLCHASGHPLRFKYSSPWLNDPELPAPTGTKASKRDVGAVIMFFFNCPGGVNCGMDWANTHAPGMDMAVPGLGFGQQPTGIYNPANPGFWKRELRDAKYAGLQFIMPNVYGPDLQQGKIRTLALALAQEADPVKVGMFDDTWPWGEKWFGAYWQAKPDLRDTQAAANKLYQAKWKPFFSQVPRKDWYLVDGKPVIFFYNAGKLEPRNRMASVLTQMKALFKRDFGVEPFVGMDKAYFEDPGMQQAADSEFMWDPLKSSNDFPGMSRFSMKGKTVSQAMVKWDPVGRDRPGSLSLPSDNVLKGPEMLDKVLKESADSDILLLATWNDLGEGTGINRNIDYYYKGAWMAPDSFMGMVRQSQYPNQ